MPSLRCLCRQRVRSDAMTGSDNRAWVIVLILLVLATATSAIKKSSRDVSPAAAADTDTAKTQSGYVAEPSWPKTLPPGRPELTGLKRRMGSTNGDVAVSSQGEIYVSVEAPQWRQSVDAWGRAVDTDPPLPSNYTDPFTGLQVYSADGTYLRNVPN